MTWNEIYNRVVFKIWGNSNPPQGTQAVLQGEYGLIANAHRRIQEDYNYWFMEAQGSTQLLQDIQVYDLPADYKEIMKGGFRLIDASTGNFHDPMNPLLPGDVAAHFKDAAERVTYPLYYEIFGGQLHVYPVPDTTGVLLALRYYAYLPRPPADWTAPAGDIFDTLTRNGYDAIVGFAAGEMCKILEEYQKMQSFEAEGVIGVELLKTMDVRNRRAEVTECRYAGL